MPETIQRDLDFAIAAAREAGRRLAGLREERKKKEPEAPRWEGATLGDVGDQAADGYLQGLLRGRYPDDGVLSEETRDDLSRTEKERCWIVDPLDGTKEYSQRREDWAVHVALTVGGRCALGAVALPSIDTVLWGVSLEGRERAGSDRDATLARGDSPSPAVPRVAVSRSHTPPWVESFASELGGEMHGWGSVGFKVSRLLLGEADVYVHKVGLKEWDTCAPEVVARSLGWHVCKLRGEEHAYNRADPVNHELVICRPAMRDRVLEAVARSGALD